MHTLSYRLLLGCSTAALVATAALAQQNQTAPDETVVVTGTSIRGVAPVGANLISVTSEDIKATGAQTVSELLVNVPAITGMGSAGQGENHTSYYQPTIHQLGSSLSNATLVLIDSHRAPAGDTNHPVVDPNIVPVNMIERVEVLADGSSSTYGSEAIAGVINFITRKKFDGVQLGGGINMIDGQQQLKGNLLVGTTSDKTSVLFAYQYSHDSPMLNISRPYTNPDQRSRGGTNFATFNCDPSTIQTTASGSNYYQSAFSSTILNSASINSPCSSWAAGDLLEKEVRNSVMAKGIQELGPNITFTGEAVWAQLRRDSVQGAGTLQATAYGAGPQANPFFIAPPADPTATKETIRWDATSLLGPSQYFHRSMSAYADANLEWRVNDNWVVNALANVAYDDSQSGEPGYNALNAGVATLALNGTPQTNGSTTTVSIPGTTQIINQLPLTAATALDVWDPAASNKTSAAIITQLRDSASVIRKMFEVEQFRLSANGSLFDLPAGAVKVALGFEQLNSSLYQTSTGPNGTGPATTSSRNLNLLGEHRKDSAGFVEFIVPVIAPEMNVPLVRKFEIDLSGRYDSYDDVGNTANPKASFNWDVIDGLRLKGNMSTSFVAPSIDVAGNAQFPGYYVGNTFQSQTNNVDVPIANYPILPSVPGVTCTATTCNVGAIQGIVNRSGDANVKPIKGRSWSLGVEYVPDFLPGFSAQATYWNTEEIGGITGPNFNNVVFSSSLAPLVTFLTSCATPAQIAALKGIIPQTGALPSCALYLFKDPNSNYLNLKIAGIDASVEYQWTMEGWGAFHVGTVLNQFTSFQEAYGIGAAGAYFSVLGTTGSATSFPSVSTQMRSNIGWAIDEFTADLFMNYTSAYRNWGSPVNPITLDANKNPSGGGDHVAANVTFDLHLSYLFSTPYSGEDEAAVTIRNLFDKDPPFYNSSVGYDTWVANPYGRVVELALTAKY